jgi:hypothetical protein
VIAGKLKQDMCVMKEKFVRWHSKSDCAPGDRDFECHIIFLEERKHLGICSLVEKDILISLTSMIARSFDQAARCWTTVSSHPICAAPR